MSQEHLPESDWRAFNSLHAQAMERAAAAALQRLQATLAQAASGPPLDALHAARETVQAELKELARVYDDFRRSTALTQLGMMVQRGHVSADELAGFTAESRERVLPMATPPPRR